MTVNGSEQVQVDVVGSSKFGRYPKISSEKTFNMYITDGWMCNYAGFKKKLEISSAGKGRALFNSIRGGFLIVVIEQFVYRIDNNFVVSTPIGSLTTLTGDVFIDENLASQICIVDGKNAYIYNYSGVPTFTVQTLNVPPPIGPYTFFPSYVCYHNTFFLFGSTKDSPNSSSWYAFEYDTATTIKFNSHFLLQTKPDVALAVERLPGRGNNVLVLGSTVAEVWTQVGGAANYTRVSSFNIDNGLVSVSTLASSDEFICWLGQNENNTPVIMVTDGAGSAKRLSTDGIDHALDQIKFPAQSTAFFFRQDGHLFYQLTFHNPADNLSLIYDFTTQMFFHVSDENLNFHPARHVAFFNELSYFISINDGSLYRIDTDLLTYDYSTLPATEGEEIPRIRVCKSIRKPDSSRFRIGLFTFWIEQGVNNYNVGDSTRPKVIMNFSKTGDQNFSNDVARELNPIAHFKNQIRYWRMGSANEFTIQLKFWGFNRFIIGPGVAEIY